jgi:hypothetical protein
MIIFYSIKITLNIQHKFSNSQSDYGFCYHQLNGRVSLPLHDLYKINTKHKFNCIPSVMWRVRTIWNSPTSAGCYFPSKSYVNLDKNNSLTRVPDISNGQHYSQCSVPHPSLQGVPNDVATTETYLCYPLSIADYTTTKTADELLRGEGSGQ